MMNSSQFWAPGNTSQPGGILEPALQHDAPFEGEFAFVDERGYGWTHNELRMLLTGCQESLLFTARVFFKTRTQQKFIINMHHIIMCHVLDEVFTGKIKRLIINVPPGYTKTELAVIFFTIKGLLLNERAKFIHCSYSSDLAVHNSSVIKDIILSPLFQALSSMRLRVDAKGKAKWWNQHGGGMMAAAAGGQITGFRAGYMDKDVFTGALEIDDPNKPKDALSKTKRDAVNENYTLTLKNRIAVDNNPIVLIQQRTHEDDLTGFLLKGGSKEQWHHLEIPAYIRKSKEPYPREWTHGIQIPYELPAGPLWEYKHNYDELKKLKAANKYYWASQMMQRPTATDSNVIQRNWFQMYQGKYDKVNRIVYFNKRQIKIVAICSYSDTAMKTGEKNDATCFQTWGLGEDGRIYLLHLIHGKFDSVDLERNYVRYIKRLKFIHMVNTLSVRKLCVEDKASGTGLIQAVNRRIGTEDELMGLPKITGIPRSVDKVSRALSVAPQIEKGMVVLPEAAPWVDDYLDEVCSFNVAMTHTHDDYFDPTMDAIHDLIIGDTTVDYEKVVTA